VIENIVKRLKEEESKNEQDQVLSHEEIEREMIAALHSPDLQHIDPSQCTALVMRENNSLILDNLDD
jgi:hypothetical protein